MFSFQLYRLFIKIISNYILYQRLESQQEESDLKQIEVNSAPCEYVRTMSTWIDLFIAFQRLALYNLSNTLKAALVDTWPLSYWKRAHPRSSVCVKQLPPSLCHETIPHFSNRSPSVVCDSHANKHTGESKFLADDLKTIPRHNSMHIF